MRKIVSFLLLIIFSFLSNAQNYVDLVKVTYTGVPSVPFTTNTNNSTSISQSKVLTSVPVKITDSLALLTGIDYELHNAQLFPFIDASNMSVATLKIGANFKHNAKLSGTYLLLPKLASDFGSLNNSFQIGGIALLKYKLNDQTKLIFGNYINKEIFGILNVPILGVYHKSKNEKFEADVKFPIIGYADYKLHNKVRFGADFLMIVRTFDMNNNKMDGFYTHLSSNELTAYLQFDLLNESLIIKAKAVYSMFDYGLYSDNDTTPFGMLGWYPGDERTRWNSEFENALGFKVSAIYRFQL